MLFFLLRPRPDRGGVFFCCGPARTLTHSRWAAAISARPGWCFFFLLRPRRVFLENSKKCPGYYIGSKKTRRGHSFPCLSPGPEQKKKKHPGWCFFFCSGPVPASNGASPSLAFRRGRSKKKHPGWCFFFLLWPRAGFQRGFSFPCLSPGPQQKKKNTLGGFFFCCGPARTLTHSLRAWVAMPPPRRGGAFFFAAAPPGPGWCFFFAVAPPGRSLTHGGLGRFRQGPGGVFFLLRPRRVFLENSKKCLGYYIGSKKTRRGHSKKKNTTSLL